ncbi:hypothetical protein B0H14DRAFT_3489898 [Mycena olivaceomarginata]|nr:hypothetical protein B0H14DRAFT_3489898 [Mycena olivaceomarginata]
MTMRRRKKRGQPSVFKGARFDFLTSKIPLYIDASKKKSGKEAKTEGLAPFWADLFKEYWERFPWDLPLDQDPVPDPAPLPDLDPQTAEEAVEALGAPLSPEESERKSKVQNEIKGKIKRWFFRKRSSAIGIHGNPYFAFLARLRRDEDFAKYPGVCLQTLFKIFGQAPDSPEAYIYHCSAILMALGIVHIDR